MNAAERVCLDTTTLFYAVDKRAGERHERAEEIVSQAIRGGGVLPVQALAEFFRSTTRKELLPPERARGVARDWAKAFRLVSPDKDTLFAAMDAVIDHRLSFWDAMIWAVARKAGCSVLITEDMQDGRVLDGVAFLNPFAADAEERLAAVGLEVGTPSSG